MFGETRYSLAWSFALSHVIEELVTIETMAN